MSERKVYNFYPGPATLPEEVMKRAQEEFVDYHGLGYGIAETSHRSPEFKEVIERAEQNVRDLLGVSDEYAVLFLQGGASLQFAMLPMNLMVPGKPGLYADTGSWTSKAIKEAKKIGETKVVYEGEKTSYTQIGDFNDWEGVTRDASYLYICSNNTIYGTQYHFFPELNGVPLIADMSSDIMSRKVDVSKFGAIFAGAQKNLGPAGVTLVIIHKDLADRASADLPTMLSYKTHIEKGSTFNTPPVFAVYMVGLVLDWIQEQGGLDAVEKVNNVKAENLYSRIDASDFYLGTAASADRSKMNVTFRLDNEDLEPTFIAEAAAAGLIGLKGHRSVGGIRASIYNAMPLAGVSKLIDFMGDFEEKHG
ncbi:MAG: 3-phosphoserine/phosphohydroxythreonine transaminase [Candidatus Pacebacteria bacterium]|nr:3-phosphoserine/phosphohydroxythreonine transaminase [Candidatus Paceibacterota bacterium]